MAAAPVSTLTGVYTAIGALVVLAFLLIAKKIGEKILDALSTRFMMWIDAVSKVGALQDSILKLQTEMRGLREDIRRETDAKIDLRASIDANLDTRLRRIEGHNFHDFRTFLHVWSNNIERTADHLNTMCRLLKLDIPDLELREYELPDRRASRSGDGEDA